MLLGQVKTWSSIWQPRNDAINKFNYDKTILNMSHQTIEKILEEKNSKTQISKDAMWKFVAL